MDRYRKIEGGKRSVWIDIKKLKGESDLYQTILEVGFPVVPNFLPRVKKFVPIPENFAPGWESLNLPWGKISRGGN